MREKRLFGETKTEFFTSRISLKVVNNFLYKEEVIPDENSEVQKGMVIKKSSTLVN